MAKKPIKNGEIIKLELEDLAYGGDAVARKDDFVIFVNGGLPDETALVQITEVKKSYGRGKVVKIIKSSKDRQERFCDYSSNCGGCQIDYLNYQGQLRFKQMMIKDNLERIGDIDEPEVAETIGMEHPYFYRNRAQFPLGVNDEGEIIKGFYQAGSHNLVEVEDCQLQHQLINRVARKTLEVLNDYQLSVYDEQSHSGLLRHLVIKVGVCSNQALAILVTKSEDFPQGVEIAEKLMELIPELKGVVQNINPKESNVVLAENNQSLAGENYIYDYIGRVKYKISPLSFFQVNTLQAEKLYETIKRLARLSGEEKILDAYCGIGSIGLYLADEASQVTGIEVVSEAVEMAKENAELNGIDNYQILEGTVAERINQLKNQFDVIIVDPPRKGCGEDVINDLIKLDSERIIYVSCNPSSLARDIAYLTEAGYSLDTIQPVDMFPHTYHVETVAVLEK